MAILETLLFGMIAGLITRKVALLAAAVLLLIHSLTKRIHQRTASPAAVAAKHPKLDKYA